LLTKEEYYNLQIYLIKGKGALSMKLTKTRLKQIIKEELQKVLSEEEVIEEQAYDPSSRRSINAAWKAGKISKDEWRSARRALARSKSRGSRDVGKDMEDIRKAGYKAQQMMGLRGKKASDYADLPRGVKPGDIIGTLRAGVGKFLRPNEIQFDKGSVVFADDSARAKAMAYLEKIDPDGKLFGGPERIKRAIAGAARQSPALRKIMSRDKGEIAAKMKRAMDAAGGDDDTMIAPTPPIKR
jgi:hypothetical protein